MAPAAETSSNLMLSPQRNVTFAVNYEVSIVDRFWQKSSTARPGKKQNKPDSAVVAPVHNSTDVNPTQDSDGATQTTTGSSEGSITSSKSNLSQEAPTTSTTPSSTTATTEQAPEATKTTLNSLSDEDSSSSCKENKKKTVTVKSPTQRRSSREMKKRQAPMERTRVRYDMEMVPAVKRNRAFLDKFPLWSTPSMKREDKIRALLFKQQALIKEQQKQLQATKRLYKPAAAQKQPQIVEQKHAAQVLVDQKQNEKVMKVPNEQQVHLTSAMDTGTLSDTENMAIELLQDADDMSPELVADEEDLSPFAEDTSVIWVPKKRTEWEDSVLEMTAVCTSAALRRYTATRGRSNSSKPFHAPLSKEYIRDRVDIDDPLNGYQIRHKTGGWLQGFILWTNFTTWTHYFKWDSSHAMSGIPTMNSGSNSSPVDSDGSLAADLETQPRSGNPFEGGVVFEGVAEISLVGGLGCGEYLLRMALESILAKKKYKFVVLQATDQSKTFYERYGFVRVGAICRYERKDKEAVKPGSRPDTPIMGYRHWTHPNESDTSLQKHGGPSYMMCLRLPEYDGDTPIETPFLDAMMKLEVEVKPTIEQLGGSSTPYPKNRRPSTEGPSSNGSQDYQKGSGRKFGKGRRAGSPETPSLAQAFQSGSPPVLPVLRGANAPINPSQNVVGVPGEGIPSRSGQKRTAEDTASSGTKKRRLEGGQDIAKQGETQNGEVKQPPRRTPRTLSHPNVTPLAGNPAYSLQKAFAKPSSLPANNLSTPNQPPSSKKKQSKSAAKRAIPRRAPVPTATPSSVTSTSTEKGPDSHRSGPLKQKVKSYPRDRVHYYNKVVRPKKGKKSENYFVLHYDEGKGTIRIIPMEPRGVLSGKRAGRPRFQAVMNHFDRDVKTVRCADYDIVKAFMVMKTPVVASEAWDVLDA